MYGRNGIVTFKEMGKRIERAGMTRRSSKTKLVCNSKVDRKGRTV